MGDRPEGVNDDVESGDIRADIQQTRDELSETIDAIQERLRPRNLVAQAGETVKEATVGKVKEMATSAGEKMSEAASQTREAAGGAAEYVLESGWVQRIRENPVPAIIAGFGVAWLAFAETGPALRRGYRRGYYRSDYDSAVGTTGQTGESRSDQWRDTLEPQREAWRSGGGAAERWSRGAADSVRRTSRRAGNRFQSAMRTNPLAVGAIAAGIGAAIGFALPETERENELMGQSRDAMVDRAQDMARDAAERVTNAADSVKGAGDQAIDTITRSD
jgi:ElaB/YqjD/DUF883 family membrane-anchored ribosome-binding protein